MEFSLKKRILRVLFYSFFTPTFFSIKVIGMPPVVICIFLIGYEDAVYRRFLANIDQLAL